MHLVKMTRDGEPSTADVHPDEVANMQACGWVLDDRPHLTPQQIEALDRIDDGVLKPGGAPKGGNRKRKA